MVGRISQRDAFAALAATPHRGRSGSLRVSWVPTDDAPAAAFAVSRAVGTAVVRNRVRRRLRSALDERARAGRLPDGLYLVRVSPAAVSLSYPTLVAHLDGAVAAATAS